MILQLLEGLAVAVILKVIPNDSLDPKEILYISLSIASTLILLDLFAPAIAHGYRKGAGFGLGYKQLEGFNSRTGADIGANNVHNSCGTCHSQLGTMDPGKGSNYGYNNGCPGNLLGNLPKDPMGVSVNFKDNNVKNRNYSPGSGLYSLIFG